VKTYGVVEIFETLQGEGYHAGTPATFVRLAGCNLWSGVESTRDSDAWRSGARCPMFCDTDFKIRERLTADQIRNRVADLGAKPLTVITGGEPLLQLDDDLVQALRSLRGMLAIETNGAVAPRFTPWARLWLTLSPKLDRSSTLLKRADELKLVWPAHEPSDWADFPVPEGQRFLQPQAHKLRRLPDVEQACASYVVRNPQWRLSLQTHKILGVP
jgi:organic radical activating enzyme